MEIPLADGPVTPAGPYWADGRPYPWFCCPNGHLGVLDHDVAEDGSVTPSVVCPRDECEFHEHVRLLDWSGGDAR